MGAKSGSETMTSLATTPRMVIGTPALTIAGRAHTLASGLDAGDDGAARSADARAKPGRTESDGTARSRQSGRSAALPQDGGRHDGGRRAGHVVARAPGAGPSGGPRQRGARGRAESEARRRAQVGGSR